MLEKCKLDLMSKIVHVHILSLVRKGGVTAHIFTVVVTLLILQCSNDSQILFPQPGTCGIIDGYVDPPATSAKVFLANVVAVDSVKADTTTGYFRFSDVAYGTYKLEVKADSFGTAGTVVKLASAVYTLGSVTLSRHPSQMLSISPRENSKLEFVRSSSGNDTVMEFCISFKRPVDRKTFEENFSIVPEIPFVISKETVADYRHDVYITLPVIGIFSSPLVTFSFNKNIRSIYFEPLEFNYSVNYFPDTSMMDDVISRYFFNNITPPDGAQNVTVATDVRINFKRLVDHKSVEGALKIIPDLKYETLWQTNDAARELLVIRFDELLKKGTEYAVIIDSTAFSKDKVKLTRSVSTRFSTDRFRCLTFVPAFKEMYVPDSKVLTYNFNYPVDSASFIASFSIVPPLDSLRYLFFDNRKTIMVLHRDFITDTTYTVVIDTVLQAFSGEQLASPITQTFFTGVPDSLRSSTCIQKTVPADTSSQFECTDNILLYFTGPMDRASVNQRISISPVVPFDLVWLSASVLQIRQLQPLRSNTKYTVILDSAYLTQDQHVTGSGYRFQSSTRALRLISCYPLYGQVNVACNQDIILSFSTPVDTISLLTHCYFNPPVDSISCLRDRDGRYYLRHAPFLNDKEYQFIVTDSITDKYGCVSGQSFSLNFTTVKQ